MKPVNGFQSQAPGASYPMLPKGAYVCAIQNVKIEGQEPDQQLVLRLEVIEGPYAGYFTKRFKTESANTQSRYPAKYKGDISIQIPNEANTAQVTTQTTGIPMCSSLRNPTRSAMPQAVRTAASQAAKSGTVGRT